MKNCVLGKISAYLPVLLLVLGSVSAARANFPVSLVPDALDCSGISSYIDNHIKAKVSDNPSTYRPVSRIFDVRAFCRASFVAPNEHYADNKSSCWNLLNELKQKVGSSESDLGPKRQGTLRSLMKASCDATKKFNRCKDPAMTGPERQLCVSNATDAVVGAQKREAEIALEIDNLVRRYQAKLLEVADGYNGARAKLAKLPSGQIMSREAVIDGKKIYAQDFGVITLGEVQQLLGIQNFGGSDYNRLVFENEAAKQTTQFALGAMATVRQNALTRITHYQDVANIAKNRAARASTITKSGSNDDDYRLRYRDPPPYYPPPVAAPATSPAGGGGSGPTNVGSGSGSGPAGTGYPESNQTMLTDASRVGNESKNETKNREKNSQSTEGFPFPTGEGTKTAETGKGTPEPESRAGPASTGGPQWFNPVPTSETGRPTSRNGVKIAGVKSAGGGLGQTGTESGSGSESSASKDCVGEACAKAGSDNKTAEGGEAGKGGGVPGYGGKGGGEGDTKQAGSPGGSDSKSPPTADAGKPLPEKDRKADFAALDAIFDQVAGKTAPGLKAGAAGAAGVPGGTGEQKLGVKDLIGADIAVGDEEKPAEGSPKAATRTLASGTKQWQGDLPVDLGLDISLFKRIRYYIMEKGAKRVE